jgi:Fe-S cluster biogenesis protein NfuA
MNNENLPNHDNADVNIEENEALDEVQSFIRRNFPQIQMHGGSSEILDVDTDTGYVHIVLSGACSGCGISPMTIQAMQRRMYQEIDFVENVDVDTGIDSLGQSEQPVNFSNEDDEGDDNPSVNVPF